MPGAVPLGPPGLRQLSFTDELWEPAAPVYEAILAHPFLAGLTDGTLPDETFAHYVVQDAHFLREYGRALAGVAVAAPTDTAIALFAGHAVEAIEVERELHDTLLGALGLDPVAAAATPMAPTCRAYTDVLLASALAAPFHEALGAILPCYWIYARVGAELVGRGSPDPRHQRWIDTYAGEEFAATVRAVLELADDLGAELTAAQRAAAAERFAVAARYEWMFWDMGWRGERWPV